VGITRQLPELEAWLSEHAAAWELLPDASYRELVARWDFSWCFLFSHETGSMFHEELYEA
jgi:hypothetical protein